MKFITLILFTFIFQVTFGQLSISASMLRTSDRWDVIDHLSFKSYSQPYVHHKWGVNACYVNKRSFVQVGVSYFGKKSISAGKEYRMLYGGGSSPIYITKEKYGASFGFKNIGVRLEGGAFFSGASLILKKVKTELLLSPFLQLDFKFDEVESSHSHRVIKGNNSNMNHEYVETSNEWYYDNYNAVSIDNVYVTFGLNAKRRYLFKNVFFEWQASIGFGVGDRMEILTDSDIQFSPNTSFYGESFSKSFRKLNPFFETGIGIGYIFQKKSRTNSPT